MISFKFQLWNLMFSQFQFLLFLWTRTIAPVLVSMMMCVEIHSQVRHSLAHQMSSVICLLMAWWYLVQSSVIFADALVPNECLPFSSHLHYIPIISALHMGQVTELWLSCYLTHIHVTKHMCIMSRKLTHSGSWKIWQQFFYLWSSNSLITSDYPQINTTVHHGR